MEMVSGSTPAIEEGSMRLSMARSYGTFARAVEGRARMFVHLLVLGVGLMTAGAGFAQTGAGATPGRGAGLAQPGAARKPIRIVVLGDSLSAGLGLSASAAFPERLQKALESNGIAVDIVNA